MEFNYSLKDFGNEFYFSPTVSRRSYLISRIDYTKPVVVLGISISGNSFSKIYDESEFVLTDLSITFNQEVDFANIRSIVIKNYLDVPTDLPTTDEKLESLRQYVISMSERVTYSASSIQGKKPNPHMSEGEILIWKDNAWSSIFLDMSLIEGIEDIFEQNRLLYEKLVKESKEELEKCTSACLSEIKKEGDDKLDEITKEGDYQVARIGSIDVNMGLIYKMFMQLAGAWRVFSGNDLYNRTETALGECLMGNDLAERGNLILKRCVNGRELLGRVDLPCSCPQ